MPLPTPIGRLLHWSGRPPAPYPTSEMLIASIGALLGILLISFLCARLPQPGAGLALMPSLGASAFLVFAIPHSPLTQPWSLIGGHLTGALIGVSCQLLIPFPLPAAALAVGLAVLAMHLARCLHPPAAATALAAVIGGPGIHALGYGYAIVPVGLNCLLLVLLGGVYNRAFPWRRYPLASMPRSRALDTGAPAAFSRAQIVSAMAKQRVVLDVDPDEVLAVLNQVVADTAPLASGGAGETTRLLQPGRVFCSRQTGPEWSVREIIEERPSPEAAFDLIVYRIVEGRGLGRVDSCSRQAFLAWAGSERLAA